MASVCVCVRTRGLHNCIKKSCIYTGGGDNLYCKFCAVKWCIWLLNKFETCQLLLVYYDYHYFLFTDESVDVERQSHAIIALVEELVGESVQQYF